MWVGRGVLRGPGPVKRSKPLRANIEQIKAWQRRSRDAALSSRGRRAASRSQQRRNDSAWRAACIEIRGDLCRVPGCLRPWPVQMDHLIPRAQGGPSVVANGTPWCEFHHRAKTEHQLRIHRDWLDPDQITWLEEEGHARWLEDGSVAGAHCRLFASIQPEGTEPL